MNLVSPVPDLEWERMWAPYDEPTYRAVLDAIANSDIVLEIGAGDLRLAKRIARKARKVYAVEQNQALVTESNSGLPPNCQIITGDALQFSFPEEVTVAVLLMRHCLSFFQYWNKLAGTRCRKLITNARWRLGVEIIDIVRTRLPFENVLIGWYACRCGSTGFVPGAVEQITDQLLEWVWEVDRCPACLSAGFAVV